MNQDFRVLTRFFQVAITRFAAGQSASLESNASVATTHDDVLLDLRDQLIEHYFPQVNRNLAQLQQTQIAQQLANMHQTQLQHRQKRAAEASSSVHKWLGRERFDVLLCLSQVQDLQGMVTIWSRLASLKKSAYASAVQATYDAVREQLHETHLIIVANNSTIASTISLSWYMTTRDSIDTGTNPFRFGETDTEAEHHLQAQIELMLLG